MLRNGQPGHLSANEPFCRPSQDLISMMNENNPSGNVASSQLHYTVLIVVLVVSVVTGVKRFSKSYSLLVLYEAFLVAANHKLFGIP
jgi:hypothetical protein